MNSYTIVDVFKDLVTGKLKFASRSVKEDRRALCNNCEVQNSHGVCTACGCVIRWKVLLRESKCPMELW